MKTIWPLPSRSNVQSAVRRYGSLVPASADRLPSGDQPADATPALSADGSVSVRLEFLLPMIELDPHMPERRHWLRGLRPFVVGFLTAVVIVAALLVGLRPATAVQMDAIPAERAANVAVDVQLVLAADVSGSMGAAARSAQRDGYVTALSSRRVADALLSGALGRVAVTYVEWAAAGEQLVVVPWSIIASDADLADFASRVAKGPSLRTDIPSTALATALLFAADLIDSSGIDAHRHIVDVSGNGPNDDGLRIDHVRDTLVEMGIIINGITVVAPATEVYGPYADLFDTGERNLHEYYLNNVVGGPGAFALAVGDLHDFAETLERKLILEVAGLPAKPASFASGQ
jgi:hypothetical protein